MCVCVWIHAQKSMKILMPLHLLFILLVSLLYLTFTVRLQFWTFCSLSFKLHKLYRRQTLLSFRTHGYVIHQWVGGVSLASEDMISLFPSRQRLWQVATSLEIRLETMRPVGTLERESWGGGLTPVLQMNCWVSLRQPTHLYINSLWPFWMPKQRAFVQIRVTTKNGLTLHKV